MSQSYMCPEANAAQLIEMADNAADTSNGSGEAEDEWTCALSRCQDRFESAGGNAIAENFNWGVNIFYTLHQLEINEPLKDAVACACTCEGTHNPSAWPIGGLVCQSFVFLSFFGPQFRRSTSHRILNLFCIPLACTYSASRLTTIPLSCMHAPHA